MMQFAIFTLIIWVPVTIGMFAAIPPRRAAVVSLIGAWLFLPTLTIPIPGLPDYSKFTATTVGILLATLIFDLPRLLALKPHWFDIPILSWCSIPFASAISNGYGAYDGFSQSLSTIFLWGLPYLIGRLYFGDLVGLRELATGMVVGGLSYILPCLWEMRMSPQLALNVYGISKWGGMRLGGYRPAVFLANGLELGVWMSAASLASWWLWRSGILKQLFGIPFGTVLLPSLLITNILCRSTGALILFFVGVFTLWGSWRFKTKILLLGVILLTPTYYTIRVNNLWSGEGVLDLIRISVGEDRAWSLEYRFRNENLLVERALERPLLGWGAWAESLMVDPTKLSDSGIGRAHAVPDGLWVLVLGTTGGLGLTALTFVILLPPLLFLIRFSPRDWLDPLVAPAAMFAVLLSVYMIDCLVNAMVNLIYVVSLGGLIAAIPMRNRSGTVWPDLHIDNAFVSSSTANDAIRSGARPIAPQWASKEELAIRTVNLSRSLVGQGRRDEARSTWFQAIELWNRLVTAYPNDSRLLSARCDCCNDLAWFLIDQSDVSQADAHQAITFAIKAVESFPERCDYWNTLGAAYFHAGDDQTAIDTLHRSIALQRDQATAFDYLYLSLACLRLDQHDIARSWYDQGIAWIAGHSTDHHLDRLEAEIRRHLSPSENIGLKT